MKKLITIVVLALLLSIMAGVTVYAAELEDNTEENTTLNLLDESEEKKEEVKGETIVEEEKKETPEEKQEDKVKEPEKENKENANPTEETQQESADGAVTEPKAEETAENAPKKSYSLTFSDSTSTFDTAGGTQVAVRDILAGLGYCVENAVITVNPDSVDTSVIRITDSENGPVLSDLGPFSKADKNLIVYIDGEAVEITVIDPIDISGSQSTGDVQDAFNSVTNGNVKLTGDTTVSGSGTITLTKGIHELFLENCTLQDDRTDKSAYLFTIGDDVTLNVYRKGDNGKITGSDKLFEITGTGVLNYVEDTIYATSGTGISGTGNSISYGGVLNSAGALNADTYYYIDSDITGNWTIDKANIYLDLNGKKLDGGNTGSVITIENAGLTLTDSTGYDGMITGGKVLLSSGGGGGIYVKNSTLTMNGGSIKYNEGMYGGGVYLEKSTFTMNGGEISYNIATRNGGGVHVLSNTFTMNGGSITKNMAANYGGGVYNSSGTFTMNSGNISYNSCVGTDTYHGYGGGVCSDSTSVINGGTIDHNNAKSGGGVYIQAKTFTLNGGVISGNSATSSGGGMYCQSNCIVGGAAKITGNTGSNLYLPTGKTVTVNGSNPLSGGASIGVTLQSVIGDVTGENSKDYSQYFSSDVAGCSIKNLGTYKVVITNEDQVETDEIIVIEEVDENILNDAQKCSIDAKTLDVINYVQCTLSDGTDGPAGLVLTFGTELLKGHDASSVRVWYISQDGTLTEVEFEINSRGEIVIRNADLGLYVITCR